MLTPKQQARLELKELVADEGNIPLFIMRGFKDKETGMSAVDVSTLISSNDPSVLAPPELICFFLEVAFKCISTNNLKLLIEGFQFVRSALEEGTSLLHYVESGKDEPNTLIDSPPSNN